MLQGQRDMTNVGRMVLSELCPVVEAQHAEFYVLDAEQGSSYLRLLASYASKGREAVGKRVEFSFGADLAGHPRHFGTEGSELVPRRVDGVLEFEDFAADVDRHLLRQVPLGDGLGHVGDISAGHQDCHGDRPEERGDAERTCSPAVHFAGEVIGPSSIAERFGQLHRRVTPDFGAEG